jgi:hypothetical protein
MLKYTGTERRGNERNHLVLRARNMSENISAYAAEQITTKLYRLRSFAPIAYMTGTNQTYLPPDNVLDTEFTSHTSGMEVRAGLTGSTGYVFIDPATNPSNANAGLQVNTSSIPIIAKATATHPSLGSYTAYTEYDLEADMVPLFQFAVFYNMDMEFGPGADMVISGPVHTNGNLIARNQTGFTNTLQFLDRVSAAGGFFADTAYKGPTYNDLGNADNGPGGTGPLRFQNPAGTVTDIKSSGGVWRDHKYGTSSVTPTTLNNFKTFANSNYGVNFRTSVHGVTPLVLPGVSNYEETDDPTTTDDDRDNGRQIIEPADATDSAQMKETKFARRAGLYIIVNPDDEERTGILPDASTVQMRARSYRCWLNTVNADLTHSLREVVLPGQPSYGALNVTVNALPNAYRTDTSVRHNQVLRIPKGGGVDLGDTGYALGSGPTISATSATFGDAFFWDLRRATNNRGGSPFNRSSYPYTPRPIAKIDFDMTRFKMTVDRTLLGNTSSSIYYPSLPNHSSTWDNFIFNPNATKGSYGLGLGSSFTTFPASDSVVAVQKSQSAAYTPNSITINGYTQTGSSGAITAYGGRFTIEETTQATPGGWASSSYTSSANENSVNFTPNAGTTFIRVRQYLAGGTTTQLDEQIIPITDDATTTVKAALSNDYNIVPTNSTGGSQVYNNSITEMRVYVGGVDDTANWTFTTTATSNASGSFGTGPLANRYTVSNLTSSTGYVDITAAKYGFSSVTKRFSLAKQTSIGAIAVSPWQTGYWLTVTTGTAPDPFKMYFTDGTAVQGTDLVNVGSASPWFDGVTVYIHSVDAEKRGRADGHVVDETHAPDRIDSGVRLWNGRGSVVSLDGATYPARTGFAFATNDAAYIVGHFNADGTINSSTSSTSNPGGYSARYPESSSEMLSSIMADAVTILSQPVFSNSSGYYQTDGWSDALSANRRDTSFSWSSSWMTSNPSSSNRVDGTNESHKPGAMPNLATRGSTEPGPVVGAGASNSSDKLSPSVTEISAALLMGIVPTNHNATGLTDSAPISAGNNQTSGGVHNFPRLAEFWQGTGLYIRGSMVAMFESRVAMEPWSIRVYTAASRYWGLHQSLRNVNHDLPLEPILLNARRMRFRELTATEYAEQKTTIEALPH